MKLLVATEIPPNASGDGPAVVRQLLRGWPTADLAWWSGLPEVGQHFGQACAEHACAGIPAKLMPHHRFTGVKSALLERCWAPLASRHLAQTIRRVQPDAIWAIPHNWSILPLARVLPACGVGFHVTVQDYVDVHGQVEKFGRARCRRLATLADRLYTAATTRDATSRPMMADLAARTGAPAAQMLHAGLEVEDFAFLESRPGVAAPEIRIAYAGTILAHAEFAGFVAALQRIRSALPRPVTLELFGAHSYASAPWFDAAWMHEHGNLPEPELLGRLRECSWGFAPMELTDHDPRYNRFSFPTKFITYLAAGLPVIALGHPESSVMQMARAYAVGLATAEATPEALAASLSAALSDPDPWQTFGRGVLRCARAEFDAARMRSVLASCFARCAELTARG